MINFSFKKFILLFMFLCVFPLCSCEYEEQIPAYTLSSQEQQLVNTIYSCKGLWETRDGKNCIYIRYVEKNGNKFLLCTYGTGNSNRTSNSEFNVVGLEYKYTISGNSIHKTRLKEYGIEEYGIVTGTASYDVKADIDDKRLSIAKAVTNKSHVIIP